MGEANLNSQAEGAHQQGPLSNMNVNTCCVTVQALHPSKDLAFSFLEDE